MAGPTHILSRACQDQGIIRLSSPRPSHSDSGQSETVVGSSSPEHNPTYLPEKDYLVDQSIGRTQQILVNARKDTDDTLVEAVREKLEISKDVDADIEIGKQYSTTGTKEFVLADQTNLLPPRQLIIVFLGLSVAQFVGLVDQTIVSTALPQIAGHFDSAETATWVATAYIDQYGLSADVWSLFGYFRQVILVLVSIKQVDANIALYAGRKGVLCFTLALFALGSVAAALSRTIIQLIIFRAITGVGGGGIVTLVQIIVSDIVSLRERGKYQGILGAMVALANGLGPLIGGAVTTSASWRWCFWIDAILGAVALITVVVLLPLKPVHGDMKKKLVQIDYAGTTIITISTIAVLLPLSWGGTSFPWDSAAVLAPLLIGCALICVFIIVEWKFASLPTVPLRLFRIKTVTGVYITTFLLGVVYFANLFFLPEFFQIVKGQSPIRSGISLLPFIVTQTIFGYISGLITTSTGEYKIIISIGFALWTVGSGLLSTISQDTTLAKIIGYLIISGVGSGQVLQTTLVAAQAAVDRPDMAVVTGVRNFMRLLGGAIALALCPAILNNTVEDSLSVLGFPMSLVGKITSDPTAIGNLGLDDATQGLIRNVFCQGVRNIFYFTTPCTGVAFVISLFMIERHSLNRADEAEQKAKAEERIRNQDKAAAEAPVKEVGKV